MILLGNIAKNIGDITNDAIEITKLNDKINVEKLEVSELMIKIGEFYYNKHIMGEELATEVVKICNEINDHNRIIAQTQIEINRIKIDNGVQKEIQNSGIICSSCDSINSEDTNFAKNIALE